MDGSAGDIPQTQNLLPLLGNSVSREESAQGDKAVAIMVGGRGGPDDVCVVSFPCITPSFLRGKKPKLFVNLKNSSVMHYAVFLGISCEGFFFFLSSLWLPFSPKGYCAW